MEGSRALMKLLEAADLLGMVEEIGIGSGGEMSPLTRAGIRITLKNVRESLLASHDALVEELSESARRLGGAANGTNPPPQMDRRDLRSTIEKFIEPDR